MMTRLRRLRRTAPIRELLRESSVSLGQLVQPYFVVSGAGIKRQIQPGLWQVSSDALAEEVALLTARGVGGVMLFGVPDKKIDEQAAARSLDAALLPLVAAIAATKARAPELPLFVDVCLCSYHQDGHCGVSVGDRVDNDATLPRLAQMAVALAAAGADFVCPSDMMDGRVAAIRHALDEARHTDVSIVSYAVKMASAFYGPFRAAADSTPAKGDRQSYQMQASNRREALRELAADVAEGADLLLIKPALTNLDLLRDARERYDHPLVAYQVSGEYAMLHAAGAQGLLDFERAEREALASMRRAGADLIVTYFAREWALKETP